ELELLENVSEEEKAELRSEISSLKKSLYQAKKEVRDKISYIDNIEKQLQESEERIQNLRHRFKVISSRRSSPSLYNSEEEDINMANLDLFIQIDRGLNRIENHIRGAGTPLNNPINIINGIRGSLNDIRLNYQNDLTLMTIAYNNEQGERRRWWFSYRDKNRRVGELIREKFAIQLLLQRCHTNNRDLQQRYDMRGRLWYNITLALEEQSKLRH